MRKRAGGALGRLLDRARRWVFDEPAPAFAYVWVDRIVYDGTRPAETHIIGPGR
jgi:hypothetical protein